MSKVDPKFTVDMEELERIQLEQERNRLLQQQQVEDDRGLRLRVRGADRPSITAKRGVARRGGRGPLICDEKRRNSCLFPF